MLIFAFYSRNSASRLQVASEPSEVETDDSTRLGSGIGRKSTIAEQSRVERSCGNTRQNCPLPTLRQLPNDWVGVWAGRKKKLKEHTVLDRPTTCHASRWPPGWAPFESFITRTKKKCSTVFRKAHGKDSLGSLNDPFWLGVRRRQISHP